jgi:hypothetical protein
VSDRELVLARAREAQVLLASPLLTEALGGLRQEAATLAIDGETAEKREEARLTARVIDNLLTRLRRYGDDAVMLEHRDELAARAANSIR